MTRGHGAALDGLVARVRGEYREMPGLRLTCAEASRFWQMDEETCAIVLDLLVEQGFLRRTADGGFVASAIPVKAREADLVALRRRSA